MTTPYSWKEAYKAAVLETDWGKMSERIQTAESAILARQQTLSQNHDGTPEERRALEEALNSIKTLRRDAAEWKNRQVSEK